MTSLTSTGPASSWGALGAPDWRHSTPLNSPQGPAGAGASAGAATALGGWFDGAASGSALALRAEVSPAARGMSAAQHAARVLACLCG